LEFPSPRIQEEPPFWPQVASDVTKSTAIELKLPVADEYS
jgi:hypothetical protein